MCGAPLPYNLQTMNQSPQNKVMSFLAVILLAFVLVGGMILIKPTKTDANLSRIDATKSSLADLSGLSNPYAIASSSATWISTSAATSTWVVGTESADMAALNLLVLASSTSSVVQIQVDYSDDVGCTIPSGPYANAVSNSCNWYREDLETTSGSVITEANKVYRVWTPGTTATSTISISLGNNNNNLLGHRYVRVGLAASGGNYTVWGYIPKKVQIQGAQ